MKEDEKVQGLSLEDYARIFLSHWYWFVLSAVIAVCLGVFYVLRTTPVYNRTAQLLIHDDKDGKGGVAGAIQDFKTLGLVSSNTNLNNEILTISAPDMMHEVVRRLHLDLQLAMKESLHDKPLYNDAPVRVSFAATPAEDLTFSFVVKAKSDKEVELYNFAMMGEEPSSKVISASFGQPVKTPVGSLTIEPTPMWNGSAIGQEIYVNKYPLLAIGNLYNGRLNVSLSDKESTVLNLSMADEIPDRADDILLTLIDVYNENWVKNKNRMAESTKLFINERLENLTQELDNVDSRISDFKSTNLMPDVQSALAREMQQSGKNYENLLALTNQLSMADYMREHLMDKSKDNQLLPSNVGISNAGVENLIAEYNRMMLDRMSYVENSNEDAPAVRDIDRRLASQKTAVIRSIDNLIAQIKKQIANVESSDKAINEMIASNPRQVKVLNSVQREQSVKEALYIFLLQKREENELSRTYTAWNSSVIQKPVGPSQPTSPRRGMILLVSLVLGLAVPAAILFLREMLNHFVRCRSDLDGLSIPFIGEVPNIVSKPHWWSRRKNTARHIMVEANNNDLINESMRLIRTNLDYFMNNAKGERAKVIMFTSFNPGSGKTFISANLAVAIALKKKRTLLIDLDLRKASQSVALGKRPQQGITNFLGGMTDSMDELIVKNAFCEGVDLLPVGVIPPNPAELLLTPHLEKVFEEARKVYDYVIVDCPPIEIVADANIVKNHVDVTIFVVRAGVMDKRLLPKVDELYQENKFNNIALLLNGTEVLRGRYGNYRYGYGYGYGYGGINYRYGATNSASLK